MIMTSSTPGSSGNGQDGIASYHFPAGANAAPNFGLFEPREGPSAAVRMVQCVCVCWQSMVQCVVRNRGQLDVVR